MNSFSSLLKPAEKVKRGESNLAYAVTGKASSTAFDSHKMTPSNGENPRAPILYHPNSASCHNERDSELAEPAAAGRWSAMKGGSQDPTPAAGGRNHMQWFGLFGGSRVDSSQAEKAQKNMRTEKGLTFGVRSLSNNVDLGNSQLLSALHSQQVQSQKLLPPEGKGVTEEEILDEGAMMQSHGMSPPRISILSGNTKGAPSIFSSHRASELLSMPISMVSPRGLADLAASQETSGSLAQLRNPPVANGQGVSGESLPFHLPESQSDTQFKGFNLRAKMLCPDTTAAVKEEHSSFIRNQSKGFSGDLQNVESEQSAISNVVLSQRMAGLEQTQKQFINRVQFDKNLHDAFAHKNEHLEETPDLSQGFAAQDSIENSLLAMERDGPDAEEVKHSSDVPLSARHVSTVKLNTTDRDLGSQEGMQTKDVLPDLRGHVLLTEAVLEKQKTFSPMLFKPSPLAEGGSDAPHTSCFNAHLNNQYNAKTELLKNYHTVEDSRLSQRGQRPSLDMAFGAAQTEERKRPRFGSKHRAHSSSNNVNEYARQPSTASDRASIQLPGAAFHNSQLNSIRSETSHEVWNAAQSSVANGGIHSPNSTASAYQLMSAAYSHAMSPRIEEDTPRVQDRLLPAKVQTTTEQLDTSIGSNLALNNPHNTAQKPAMMAGFPTASSQLLLLQENSHHEDSEQMPQPNAGDRDCQLPQPTDDSASLANAEVSPCSQGLPPKHGTSTLSATSIRRDAARTSLEPGKAGRSPPVKQPLSQLLMEAKRSSAQLMQMRKAKGYFSASPDVQAGPKQKLTKKAGLKAGVPVAQRQPLLQDFKKNVTMRALKRDYTDASKKASSIRSGTHSRNKTTKPSQLQSVVNNEDVGSLKSSFSAKFTQLPTKTPKVQSIPILTPSAKSRSIQFASKDNPKMNPLKIALGPAPSKIQVPKTTKNAQTGSSRAGAFPLDPSSHYASKASSTRTAKKGKKRDGTLSAKNLVIEQSPPKAITSSRLPTSHTKPKTGIAPYGQSTLQLLLKPPPNSSSKHPPRAAKKKSALKKSKDLAGLKPFSGKKVPTFKQPPGSAKNATARQAHPTVAICGNAQQMQGFGQSLQGSSSDNVYGSTSSIGARTLERSQQVSLYEDRDGSANFFSAMKQHEDTFHREDADLDEATDSPDKVALSLNQLTARNDGHSSRQGVALMHTPTKAKSDKLALMSLIAATGESTEKRTREQENSPTFGIERERGESMFSPGTQIGFAKDTTAVSSMARTEAPAQTLAKRQAQIPSQQMFEYPSFGLGMLDDMTPMRDPANREQALRDENMYILGNGIPMVTFEAQGEASPQAASLLRHSKNSKSIRSEELLKKAQAAHPQEANSGSAGDQEEKKTLTEVGQYYQVAYSSLRASVQREDDGVLSLAERPTAMFPQETDMEVKRQVRAKAHRVSDAPCLDFSFSTRHDPAARQETAQMTRPQQESSILSRISQLPDFQHIEHSDKPADFITGFEKFTQEIQDFIESKDEQMKNLISDRSSQYKATLHHHKIMLDTSESQQQPPSLPAHGTATQSPSRIQLVKSRKFLSPSAHHGKQNLTQRIGSLYQDSLLSSDVKRGVLVDLTSPATQTMEISASTGHDLSSPQQVARRESTESHPAGAQASAGEPLAGRSECDRLPSSASKPKIETVNLESPVNFKGRLDHESAGVSFVTANEDRKKGQSE